MPALRGPLLNTINLQSLIATESARICLAAKGGPVMEFDLRRAQGIDGWNAPPAIWAGTTWNLTVKRASEDQ